MGPGEFFAELGVVEGVRTVSVVSLDSVTCLLFYPGKPTLFAARGSDVHLPSVVEGAGGGDGLAATTEIDVSTTSRPRWGPSQRTAHNSRSTLTCCPSGCCKT
jgi:hypothetical protein